MIKKEIIKIIERCLKEFYKEEMDFSVEISDDKNHGDYSTNAALVLAKKLGKNSREVAEEIKNKIDDNKLFLKIEIAGPGFINFFISEQYLQAQILEIIRQKEKFGALKIGKNQKINIDFISANPTGPLTLGNGRGGFCGDVLANILKKAGYKVTREYYINDTGAQIKKLGHSVIGDAEAVYKGEYIAELRKKLLEGRTFQYSAQKVGERAARFILEKMIKPSIRKMGIKFDVWFSEKSLYRKKEVDKAIKLLAKKGTTYSSEDAVWFRSKNIGDDKDRVLVRKDGIKTYFASDIAHLLNRLKKGFGKLIFFWGADHYGYVARMKAAFTALGYGEERASFIIMQMVKLFKDGKEVRMSKRTGTYVTIDELVDEVGLDAARFFFLTRSSDTHLNFDMNLAKEQSVKNLVYYVQYAHARICAILRKSSISKISNPKAQSSPNLQFLKHENELALIKQLIRLPEVVEDIAKDYQVQRLPQYAVDLADSFHKFYENCRVISEDKKLTQPRLALVLATKITLKNTLDLMGVSSPEKMQSL